MGLLVLALLVAAGGSFILRWNNERANRDIIVAVDFREFEQAAMYSGRDVRAVLLQAQAAGVTAVGVREDNLRDMAQRGQITLFGFGEYLAYARLTAPALYQELAALDAEIGPVGRENIVAVSADPATSERLYDNLVSRFTYGAELARVQHNGADVFIINAPHTVTGAITLRTTNIDIGFDNALLEWLDENGFAIILRPGVTRGSETGHWDNLETAVRRFGVQHIIFATSVNNATEYDIARMAGIVERNGLVIGAVESTWQVGFLPQPGLPALLAAVDYQATRVYSTTNDDFVNHVRDRYHRWVRAIIDRSIRILYIAPFRDTTRDIGTNLDDTLVIIADFTNTISGRGYQFSTRTPLLDTSLPGMGNRLALGLSLAVAGVLYLALLFKLCDRSTLILLIAALGSTVIVHIPLGSFTALYALAAAILYPSLGTLLLLIYLKKYSHHIFPLKLLASLGILLATSLLGGYTVVASLADIRYTTMALSFRGVRVALFLPLAAFAVNYFCVFNEEDDLLGTVKKLLFKSPTYLVLGAGALGAVFLLFHITRSGNAPVVTVTTFELRIREVLEGFFLARPRFRELVLGYPALVVMVYLYHKYKWNLLLLVMGFFVMMGATSIVNSFCHAFTGIYISAYRTAAGLVSGLLVGVAALVGVIILERVIKWTIKTWPQLRLR
jgi:hypothetical protein